MSALLQSLPEPHPELDSCVVVPCKDEAGQLLATLTALAGQVDWVGRPLRKETWEIVLLINNSTDGSFALARQFQEATPWLVLHVVERNFPASQANIGRVRKVLMDTASERLSSNSKPLSLILSTDADTEVATDWLVQNRAEICRGAEAVGGRILLRPGDCRPWGEHLQHLQQLDDRYHLLLSWLEDQLDPQAHDSWPRHHQHFAANLAVRPEVYRRVGGMPPKESLEDVAFYEALVRQDTRFRHSPDVCVHTSGRLEGRTARGLAEQLRLWSKSSSPAVVPSVRLWERLFALRKQLRTLWQQVQGEGTCCRSGLESFSAKCGARLEEVEEALGGQWFGSACESLNLRSRLETQIPHGSALQSLDEAVRQLQQRFYATHLRSWPVVEKAQSDIAAL